MKKQLLLGCFIAIILCAPIQASISHAALRVKSTLEPAPISQISDNDSDTSLVNSAGMSTSFRGLEQPSNQLPEETATPTLTQPPEKKNLAPTRTPRPTSTPIPIPPSASPSATTLMILVSLIAVIVVVVGVWLNRPEK
jgi:hypothetical protein